MTKVRLYTDEMYTEFATRITKYSSDYERRDAVEIPEKLVRAYERAETKFWAARDAIYAAAGKPL